MNDSDQSRVQLFWTIQEIIPHIEIHRTLHKKWMILTRVVFNYSIELKKLSHTLRFMPHYIRNEWFWLQLRSTIRINSRNYPTHWHSYHIVSEMNDSDQSYIQLLWCTQEIIAHIEIHSTLHKKWMILTRVVFSYSDEFKKSSHTLRFIAHYIRNEWFWKELCSAILMNSRNHPAHWDS